MKNSVGINRCISMSRELYKEFDKSYKSLSKKFEIILEIEKGIENDEVITSLIKNFIDNVGDYCASRGSAQINVTEIKEIRKRKKKKIM